MKHIIYLCLYSFLLICITSCASEKEKAKDEMQQLSSEIDKRADALTVNEWRELGKQYKKINLSVLSFDYSDDELKEIDEYRSIVFSKALEYSIIEKGILNHTEKDFCINLGVQIFIEEIAK